MRPTMIRDEPLLHALRATAALPPAWAPPEATDPALVLFVGDALRPDRALADELAANGLRCLAVSSLAAARAACGHLHFDAVLADARALGPSLALGLASLQQAAACPLLVADAQPSEVDEIIALEHGASQYLGLPLSGRRLRAHLLAALRSPPAAAEAAAVAQADEPSGDALRDAGWTLEPASRELRCGERSVALPATLFAILQALAAQPGRLLRRAELEACVSRADAPLTARSIDVYVHRLRRRLAEGGAGSLDIACVRGRGYRLHRSPAARPLI